MVVVFLLIFVSGLHQTHDYAKFHVARLRNRFCSSESSNPTVLVLMQQQVLCQFDQNKGTFGEKKYTSKKTK
jgi:hypothetical protein